MYFIRGRQCLILLVSTWHWTQTIYRAQLPLIYIMSYARYFFHSLMQYLQNSCDTCFAFTYNWRNIEKLPVGHWKLLGGCRNAVREVGSSLSGSLHLPRGIRRHPSTHPFACLDLQQKPVGKKKPDMWERLPVLWALH